MDKIGAGKLPDQSRLNNNRMPLVEDDALSGAPLDKTIITQNDGSADKNREALISLQKAGLSGQSAPPGNSKISTGTGSELLLAEDALTDIELWRVKIPPGAKAPPAFGPDGSLYIVNDKGISVVSPEGKVTREISISGLETEASPLVGGDGTIYVSGTYKIKGLTAFSSSGELLWEKDCGSSSISPAAGPDGTVLFGSNRGWVHQFERNGAEVMWCPVDDAYGAKIRSLVPGDDGLIYASSTERGGLYVIDGKELLHHKQGRILFNAPRSEADNVMRFETSVCPVDSPEKGFVYPNNLGDLCFRKPDGSEVWRVSSKFLKRYDALKSSDKKEASKGWIASAFGTTPVISNGTIYVGTVPLHKFSSDGEPSLVALDPEGNVKWKTTIPLPQNDFIGAGNVQAGDDGTIYVAGESGGVVVAVSPEGKLLWGFREGSCHKDFRIATRGDVTYLTTKDGSIHALKTDALKERLRNAGDKGVLPIIVVEDDMISIDGMKLPVKKSGDCESLHNY